MGGDFLFKACGGDFMRFDQQPLTWGYILVTDFDGFY